MIDQSCIEQVKAAANIVDVVGRVVKLKEVGPNLVGSCPFHNEKTPSFKVSRTKNIFKCFGCGESGDSIDFVMKHDKKTFLEAVGIIAGYYNIDLLEEVQHIRKVYIKPTTPLGELSSKTLNWFMGRGINPTTLRELKVTQADEWMPKAKAKVETICFNYYRNDEIVNVKYRADNKDFKLAKDAELIFYNLNSILNADTIVITEGEIDCLSVYQSGFKAVISVPNGATSGNQKLDYLTNCADLFVHVKKIVLFVDNDEPGMNLRDELARRFGFDRCFKVEYPAGCKDANDILLKSGPQIVIDTITYAKEFPIEGIFTMREMYEDVESYYKNGYPAGVRVGIPEFDDHLQFMFGQFTTITGIPGSGKSEFTDYMMTQVAKNHGWTFAICSFENQPVALHVTKIMEKYVGKSFAKRFDESSRINRDEFNNAVNFVGNHFHFININKVEVTLQGILDKTKELVLRKGIKGLLIDPWNYIEHKSMKGQTETQYVSECLTILKSFALTHGLHIFLIAHPLKMPKVSGKYEVPTLYNISGSAHFFNKTDNGITVYRDYDTNNVDVHIQKVRYSWLGKIGMCSFTYNIELRQYEAITNVKEPPPTINPIEIKPPPVPEKYNAGFQQNTASRPPAKFWNND